MSLTQASVPQTAFVTARGVSMPQVGYGTMLFPEPERAMALIAHAINCGYRHIDTARKYGSEQWVGEAVRACGVPRYELWITTKVTEDDAKAADFARSVETSLKTLGVDYVDLLLIHWPQPRVPLAETLGALAKAKREGLARNIGVSNFTVALIEEAMRLCPEPIVANQIEVHAYLKQDKVLAACRKHDLIVTAYCPLARGELLDDPVLGEIARAKGKTIAQVAQRWIVQQGFALVPRGLEEKHIEENLDLYGFSLSEDEMAQISALRERNTRIADPEIRRPIWDIG